MYTSAYYGMARLGHTRQFRCIAMYMGCGSFWSEDSTTVLRIAVIRRFTCYRCVQIIGKIVAKFCGIRLLDSGNDSQTCAKEPFSNRDGSSEWLFWRMFRVESFLFLLPPPRCLAFVGIVPKVSSNIINANKTRKIIKK